MIELAPITPPETFPALAPRSAFPERAAIHKAFWTLRKISVRVSSVTDREAMTRKCCRCDEVKPLTEFHRSPTHSMGRKYACRSCESKRHRDRRSLPTTAPIALVGPPRKTLKDRIAERRASA